MKREFKEDYCPRSPKYKLKNIFGKVAAAVSLVASLVFYPLAFQLGRGFYNQWEHNKEVAAATWRDSYRGDEHTKDLPWAAAVSAFGVSIAAGFTGLALAKAKYKQENEDRASYGLSPIYYPSSRSSDDNFLLGYVLGSNSRSSGYSSSSGNNGGAAAAFVIVAAAAAAASAGVVSYKSMKANFTVPSR